MELKILSLLILFSYPVISLTAQENYSNDPLEAQFVTEDVDRFWEAFDEMEKTGENTYEAYIERGTPGLKGFISNRILGADSLYSMVLSRKNDYVKSRDLLLDLDSKRKRIISIYSAMKYWYPEAVFPPVYFVVGRFNSGGTVSEAGVILGVEMQADLESLPGLVAHELIHFQQKNLGESNSLLFQSLIEGSADFIGELISGQAISEAYFEYGEKNKEALCLEFVQKMNKNSYNDWLYMTSGKDERPNDLGYWMGYKITEAYFYKQKDKIQAIEDILMLKNPQAFLEASGFLDDYLKNGID